MTESVVEFRGVAKSFKTKTVLREINFGVDRGRVVGLLGKNGAGKTTLLKCAMGLLRVSSGSALAVSYTHLTLPTILRV